MPTIMISAPTYIGCRTTAYNPVSTTGCSASTVTVAAANSFWPTTSIDMPRPNATKTLPTTTTGVGTCDQPNRWSSALTTAMATTTTYTPTVAIFCIGRVSASGPERRRRANTSGLRIAQYTVGLNDTAVKTPMKTQACQ